MRFCGGNTEEENPMRIFRILAKKSTRMYRLIEIIQTYIKDYVTDNILFLFHSGYMAERKS